MERLCSSFWPEENPPRKSRGLAVVLYSAQLCAPNLILFLRVLYDPNWCVQGQIIAANSYQVTLLNGEIGQPPGKLYLITTVYLVSSIIWWALFRTLRSNFVLSIPFLVSFFCPPIASSSTG